LRCKYAFVGETTLELLHVLPALHARLSNFLSTFILRTPSVLQACKLSQLGCSEKLAGQFFRLRALRPICDHKKVLSTCVYRTTWSVFARKPLVVQHKTGCKTSFS
jgi:hypothetical protein